MITDRNNDFQDFDDEIPPYIESEYIAKPSDMFSNPLNLAVAHATVPVSHDYVLPSLPRGEVGSLVAAGGTGKSMLALQVCYAIASGLNDFIGDVGQGATAYLSFEDRASTIEARAYNIAQSMVGVRRSDVERNVHVFDLSTHVVNIINDHSLVTNIIEMLKARSCRLCFIDTLVGIHKGDENSNVEMASVIARFRQIAQGANCAVVFLHHLNKSAALNGLADVQQASRGASALTDNVRWQGFLVTMTEDEAASYHLEDTERKLYVRFGVSKVNYGIAGADMWFKRNEFGVLAPVSIYKPSSPKKPSYATVKGGM